MDSVKDTYCYYFKILFQQIFEDSKAAFQEIGLTRERYIVLYFIGENPGLTQAELADTLYKDRNVIGRNIDALEEMNYVRRVRGTKDRRSFSLFLTEEGEQVVRDNWYLIPQSEKARMDRLTKQEQQQLMQLLKKIID